MTLINRLRLERFRNFKQLDLSFSSGINQIVGENGIGKTNILEAIYLLSTGRSFRTANLSELIQHGQETFRIEAIFEKEGIEQSLVLFFDGTDRRMKHNETVSSNFTALLGLLPSVIYAPSDIQLITGSPKDRRRFLNLQIAQSDPLYVYYLGRYSRALLQRNTLLKQKKLSAIDVWEQELSSSATYLMAKRRATLKTLSELTRKFHTHLSGKEEKPLLFYLPSIQEECSPEVWKKQREKELELGYTLLGPHRDDFFIKLDGKGTRQYASEGQKRTLISAMKLAECLGMEAPIFSIDDFGAHLDPSRQALFKEEMKNHHQIFITSPQYVELSTGSNQIRLKADGELHVHYPLSGPIVS
jgi:DNA replication and repair protein RecF